MKLNDTPSFLAQYWGKADPTVAAGGGVPHHTVLGHSLDVAACAFVLVNDNPKLCARLSAASGLDTEFMALTLAAVCALHDIGKLDTRFQRKAPQVADALRPHSAQVVQVKYDHGAEGFHQLEDDEAARERLHARLGVSALPLLRAVCGHHGSLPSRAEPNPNRVSVPRNLRREDERARLEFLDLVVDFFVSRNAQLPWPAEVDGPMVQRLAGLCAVADWLGSNVEHFDYRPGPILDLGSYWEASCLRARAACERAGLLRTDAAVLAFEALFPGYSPRDVQVLTEQFVPDVPALVIVEAEMGKGKTEAALALASRFVTSGLGEGMTIGLPTMATSNAMFGRVRETLPRLFPSGSVLALAHSRASRQTGFQSVLGEGLRARDTDAPEASVTCARWLLNKKRILLAQVGVGTIDQALQAALVVRHQFVRMFGLSRNVVIIDEVHAYDAYMEVLLEHLLGWLGALGVPVILLSATLPSQRRAALAAAWSSGGMPGEAASSSRDVLPDSLAAAQAKPYPLVSVTSQFGTSSLSSPTPGLSRVLFLEYASANGSDVQHANSVAQRLVAAARAGARVVWIRNTVREAQQAFRQVTAHSEGIEHLLFHARFRGCDRAGIETAVLERFGKSAPAGGRILVATQVVEQSLDLDFDEMHTDLAPIDLLFQRAGRLHRHQRERLKLFAEPRLVVHGPAVADAAALRFGPSRFVYDAGTLWITDRCLRSRRELQLPADIRLLVEETYHPESRAALLRQGGEALLAAEAKLANELAARRTKAKQCCIPPTSADPDGGEMLPDDEDAVQAFTRDGSSVTLLPLDWDGSGVRPLFATGTATACDIDASRPGAWQLAGELLDQTLSLPARGEAAGAVSGSEQSAWDAWRQRFSSFADDSGLGRRVVPLPMRRQGDTYKGWLRMSGKTRRVAYTVRLGLFMPSEKDEEQAR